MSDSPGSRLAQFREGRGLSQRAVAASLGVSAGRVGSIETGSAPPSRAFLEKLSATYGVSADWLLYGRGDMLMPLGSAAGAVSRPDSSRPMPGLVSIDGIDYARIPRLALDISAGNGLGPAEDGVEDGVLMPRDWLVRRRLAPDLCRFVQVRGDSMAPAIPDGALALVNPAERLDWPRAPGPYALTLDGEALVKRIAVAATGPDGRPSTVVLLSDNPAFPPRTVTGNELELLRVVGRIRGLIAFL